MNRPRNLNRALVVDCDPIWRSAVERGLEAYGIRYIVSAPTLQAAKQLFQGDEDLIVTEVLVAHETCFGFLTTALSSSQALVIAMSSRAARPQIFRLRDYRVSAYLDKPFPPSALHQCLESLAKTPEPSSATQESSSSNAAAVQLAETALQLYRERYHLTNAEVEVLRNFQRGMRRIEIARERCISINTIKTQVRSILNKTGLPNVQALIRNVEWSCARDLTEIQQAL